MFSMQLIERKKHGKIVYPTCSLSIQKGEAVALYSQSEILTIIMQHIHHPNIVHENAITIDHLCNVKNYKAFLTRTSMCFYEDGLYDRLTVKDHLQFYKQLYGSNLHIETVLEQMMLEDRKKQVVSKLTFSERKRVHFCRILFQDASLYVFEEPDINVDNETKRVYLQLLETLQANHKYTLILTSNLEHAITATSHVLRLDEHGCKHVQFENETPEPSAQDTSPFQFDKIPTKIDDKILLFDPFDIDYIESVDGQAFLHVNNEPFPTTFTLHQLEARLQPFGFFRCHRSYIVNLQKVKEIITWTRNSFNIILDNYENSSIPLSKTKMAQLKEMIGLT